MTPLDSAVSAIPNAQLLSQPAAALVDSARQAAAARLIRWEFPGWLVMVLAQIVVLGWFWRSGRAAALRDLLRRRLSSEFAVRFVYGAALAAIAKFAALVPAYYLYRYERTVELTGELSAAWFAHWLIDLVGAMLVAGVVVAVVLWLVDRTHQWYIYAVFGIIGAALLVTWANPYVIAPLFERTTHLSTSQQTVVDTMETRAHLNVPVALVDRSRRAPTVGAALIGLGSSRSIVVGDTVVRDATPREFAYFVAHELAHAQRNDDVRRALLQALIVIFAIAIAVYAADRMGFRRDDDPVSRLALAGALLGCVYLVAVPLYVGALRSMERQADVATLAILPDRATAVRAMIRIADERLIDVCPGPVSTLFFERSPSIAQRVAALNRVTPRCP